jgi:hypothetical protein
MDHTRPTKAPPAPLAASTPADDPGAAFLGFWAPDGGLDREPDGPVALATKETALESASDPAQPLSPAEAPAGAFPDAFLGQTTRAWNIQESTVQVNHTEGLVNFYTTRRAVFLQIVRRNPNFTKAVEIRGGGYEVDYPIAEVRGVWMLLKPCEGSAEDQFLTDQERAKRAEAGERLKAYRNGGPDEDSESEGDLTDETAQSWARYSNPSLFR